MDCMAGFSSRALSTEEAVGLSVCLDGEVPTAQRDAAAAGTATAAAALKDDDDWTK